MKKLSDRILEGLGQAVAHAQGARVPGLRVHVPKSVNVTAIRRKKRLLWAIYGRV